MKLKSKRVLVAVAIASILIFGILFLLMNAISMAAILPRGAADVLSYYGLSWAPLLLLLPLQLQYFL